MQPLRSVSVVVAAAALGGAVVVACTSFDAPADEATDAGGDATADGAPNDTDGDASEADAGSCGERSVRVPTAGGGFFCIDATEVTQADYQRFVAAKMGDLTGQAPECATNGSYAPMASCPANPYAPATRGAYPVTCVDWCDAVAYCKWAGKRLCGAVGGGAVAGDRFRTMDSQWFAACTRSDDGLHARAYGNDFDGTRCAGAGYFPDPTQAKPIPAGSAKRCEGGYPGLFDMMGNVYEWEDACIADAGLSGNCRVRGGQYAGGQDYHYCAWGGLQFARSFTAEDIGFRCCSP